MKQQKCLPLLNDEEIKYLIYNYYLYERGSFFVIHKEKKGYDLDKNFPDIASEIAYIREAIESGHTIVIKNMEDFNERIEAQAKRFGEGTDVHLYMVPDDKGDSFDWHTDDREVMATVVKGKKKFEREVTIGNKTNIQEHFLEEGDWVHIPKGMPHKATPIGPSILLSFGIPCTNQEDA